MSGTSIGGDVLRIDIVDPSGADGIIPLSEITLDIFKPQFGFDVGINLLLEAGINDTLPAVQAEMHLKWGIDYNATTKSIEPTAFTFNFQDIGINLGDFLSRHIRPVLEQITKYIEPLQPVIDMLKTKVPGVNELSEARGNGEVTFLDLALQKEPEQAAAAKKFINALDTILRMSSEMNNLERDDLVFILQDKLVIVGDDTDPDADLSDPDVAGGVSLDNADLDAGNTAKKSEGFVKRLLQSLEDLGIKLHILDVKNIISMFLHRPADIISYDVPRLELDFSWEKSFPIWAPPPIDVRVGLDLSVFADLSIGFDTHGIVDTGNFFNGFYFGDRADVFAGKDIDEFGLSLGVRLAALLNLAGLASVGIEGEIRGDATANWRDVDDNGKMYLDEISRIVKQDGFDCLFDLGVDVHAIVRLVWETALTGQGSHDFIDAVILSLQHMCPEFQLAHVVTAGTGGTPTAGPAAAGQTGTLIIHAGPYAPLRLLENSSDVPEEVTVTQMAPGVMKVELLGLEQIFTDVTQIYMSGGAGDDTLTLFDVTVPVTAYGGAGNDILYGSSKKDYLDGGAGNDFLDGDSGDDDIYGGTGQDVIFAGHGKDTVSGGAGQDIIFGQEENDTIEGGSGVDLLIGGGGDDTLRGDDGNDVLLGGQLLASNRTDATKNIFRDLRDQLLVGAPYAQKILDLTNNVELLSAPVDGNDTLVGGVGNDLLIGDDGSDKQFGGWGNDVIIGHLLGSISSSVGEYMEGGPGNDTICGTEGVDTIFGGTADLGLQDVLNDAGRPEASGGYSIVDCDSPDLVTIVPDFSSKISGVLFEDLDLDGHDPGEPILIGWSVELLDADGELLSTVVSDSTGKYEFTDVESGLYTVRQVAPVGWTPVSPTGGERSVSVSGSSGSQTIIDQDFGNRRDAGRIVVTTFHDLNGDGARTGAEKLVSNWQIEIVGPNGSLVQLTGGVDSDGDGQIEETEQQAIFDNLPAGDYIVRQMPALRLGTKLSDA